jgi:hypothetical protein
VPRLSPWVVCLLAARPALADPQLSPITNRDYSIELYDGIALGNGTLVGMGGAATANASGTSGTLINPSAPAVRLTTDTDAWSWDYHIDYLIGSLSTDYDNNGITRDGGTSVLTAGLGGRYHDWAIAFTGTDQYALVQRSGMSDLRASTLRFQFAAARWVNRIDAAVGVSVQSAQFDLKEDCPGCASLFTISGGGLEAGATWIPRWQSLRVAAAVATPIVGGQTVATCDPMNCEGFILPDHVVTAWRTRGGFAYRIAPTPWNQKVGGWFRDERSLTLAADLVVAGSTTNAYGLEAFSEKQLQRSGRHAAFSARAGAEYEWLPGRLRVRAGSYWEPGRFEGVSGRLHGTFGVDVRVFQFWFWGTRRRGRLGLTADLASRYKNLGLGVGFWH